MFTKIFIFVSSFFNQDVADTHNINIRSIEVSVPEDEIIIEDMFEESMCIE